MQFMESHVHPTFDPAMSAAYMRDGHGIGIGGHREEFVVTLLVEHPASRLCPGVSENLGSRV